MDGLKAGCFVKATHGREKEQLFIILARKEEYVYLVDGKSRTIKKPKRKNKKHVKDLGFCIDKIESDLLMEGSVRDEDIKRAIKLYRREKDVKG